MIESTKTAVKTSEEYGGHWTAFGDRDCTEDPSEDYGGHWTAFGDRDCTEDI